MPLIINSLRDGYMHAQILDVMDKNNIKKPVAPAYDCCVPDLINSVVYIKTKLSSPISIHAATTE